MSVAERGKPWVPVPTAALLLAAAAVLASAGSWSGFRNTCSVINERKEEIPRAPLASLKATAKRHVGQAACAGHHHRDPCPLDVIKHDC